MREIKFRGRNINNGHWTCGDLIQVIGEQGNGRKYIVNNKFGACFDGEGNFINTESPFVNEVDPETVGKYIGRNSDDGDNIYEGDVLYTPWTDQHHIVIWDEIGSGFLYQNTDPEKSKLGAIDYYEFEIDNDLDFGLEIAGNIYEHHFLLPKATISTE